MTIQRVTAPKLCGTSLDSSIVSTVAPTTPPMNRTGEGGKESEKGREGE